MAVIGIGAPGTSPVTVNDVSPNLDALTEAIQPYGDEELLFVSRTAEHRRLGRAMRLLYGAERVAVLHVEAPVTAWTLMLHGLSVLPQDRLAAAGGAAEALREWTRTRLVLSSVARLDGVQTTFKQHLISMWPPKRFAVDLLDSTVEEFSGTLPLDGYVPIAAHSKKAPVKPETPGWPIDPGAATDLGTIDCGWKAGRWLETSTLMYPPEQIIERVLGQPAFHRCPSCNRQATADHCLFCELPVAESTLPSEGVPA